MRSNAHSYRNWGEGLGNDPSYPAGWAGMGVKVPSARDGGVTGIMNPVVMNADKGAGNTERHALSSSAWRFTERTVEIFHKGKRVGAHMRGSGNRRHTTIAEHMPSAHRRALSR